MSPAPWIYCLPREEAMPMEMFFSAPPKPPMGCPLKWESTSRESYAARDLTPAAMLRLYGALGVKLEGKVAVKLHSGEPGNQNFLRPDFMKPMIDHVGGVIVECNTLV